MIENFNSLHSQGEIPNDFLQSSSQKSKEEIKKNKDKNLDKKFFIDTRFFIDNLLLSGQIVFNHPASTYVSDIGNLIVDNDELNLRYYILKSTTANAFSTDQGIILITTGLLARLESEAQLAFVLAHEATHYIEKHVKNEYIERKNYQNSTGRYTRTSYNDGIKVLSTYGRRNEVTADRSGIDLMLKTNYDYEEVLRTFDILAESDYPIARTEFDFHSLDSDVMIIPRSWYPDTIIQEAIVIDNDDRLSTHPNIKNRIRDAKFYTRDKKLVGNQKFLLSEDRFNMVRNLSRFECVNILLQDRKYVLALFEIIALRSIYKNNRFLDLAFVKSLYGLAKYKNANRYEEVIEDPKSTTGQIASLNSMLSNIKRPSLNIIAYRHIHDICKLYPKDEVFQKYYSHFKIEFASNSKINFTLLKEQQEIYIKNISSVKNDSTKERISKSDPTNFAFNSLIDLILEDNELETLSQLKIDLAIERENQLNEDIKKPYPEINKIIIVDPIYQANSIDHGLNLRKSEKKKEKMVEIYNENYESLNLETICLDSKNLNSDDVDSYNEIGSLKRWMNEVIEHDGLDIICSSNELVTDIKDKYQTEEILFSGFFKYKERTRKNLFHFIAFGLIITAPIAMLDLLVVHNYFQTVTIHLNCSTDKLISANVDFTNFKGTNSMLRAHLYALLYDIKHNPFP